jgi:hypothetical protein
MTAIRLPGEGDRISANPHIASRDLTQLGHHCVDSDDPRP